MISGFNTDVKFDGTVYHVQTEDKGAPSMVIMSLVYDRGTILASKRESYQDLIQAGLDEKKLAERVSRQHKLICAAVKAGRLSELKEMTARSAAGQKKPRVSQPPVAASATSTTAKIQANPQVAPTVSNDASTIPTFNISLSDIVLPEKRSTSELVIDAVSIVEEEILPAEAVAVISELSGKERPVNNKLKLELLGESKFKSGERRTVNIMVCRGTSRKVVAGAQIMIKVLGSAFRPVIFHAKSATNG